MKTGINDPAYNRKPRRISVAGIGDAGSKTNSMETGIIDPAYSKNKSAPLLQRGALNELN